MIEEQHRESRRNTDRHSENWQNYRRFVTEKKLLQILRQTARCWLQELLLVRLLSFKGTGTEKWRALTMQSC